MHGDGGRVRAGRYDAWFEAPWGRYAWALESELVGREMGDVAGLRVLDVGCGTGRAGAVARARGASVVGADPDPAMVAIARERIDAVVAARGEQLPFPDRCFDAAVAVTVLEFVADPPTVLAEMGRVTRSPGTIVVGLLNARSPWGRRHGPGRRSGMWQEARFLATAEMAALGRRYGTVAVTDTLRAPGWLPGLSVWGAALEWLGQRLGVPGAFEVLTIDRR